MPTPNSGESEDDFVSRCIPIVMHENPKMKSNQAAAICHDKFREESMHPDFERILSKFIKRFGKEGIKRFVNFTKKNGLDILKAYNPAVQFGESFEWIEPLIKPYKSDTEAKYYLISALTADISMNNTDYGPEDRLAREDSSMNWRPVNIDHDHSKWLPYPRTRIDFSAMNDFTLEATLRVDNQDAWLQKMLDNGEIIHPSIEGRPHPIKGRYHFTGLALIRKGVELPGEPLSDIVPLVFNESVGRSLCEFKDGMMVCECKIENEVKNNLRKETIKEALLESLREQEGTTVTGSEPIASSPQASGPEKSNQPSRAPECPTGYHWDGKQCVEDEVGASNDSTLVKLPGPAPAQQQQELVEVPQATVSTTGNDDKATCPRGQHWDQASNSCVEDVKQECEEGWVYDTALQKCVPRNPQVNERKTISDLRLENAKLRVDLIHTNDRLKEQLAIIGNKDRAVAEKNLEIMTHLTANATLEGRISEKQGEVRKLESQVATLNKEAQDYMKRNHNLGRDVEDNNERITVLQESMAKIVKNRDDVLKENQKLIDENLKVSSDLTEVRNKEVQWNREKKDLQEGLAKAMKHQKYVYEFLKSKGFEFVGT